MVILIGMGGVALTGLAQQTLKEVREHRYQHNKEMLEQAKEALLMYVYRSPQFNSEGPGRLPCPDEDNDGTGDANGPSCVAVGRFPWNHVNLDFFEPRDSSGETLWYAVSDSFHNLGGGPATVNSDSVGTISIVDQSGNLIYDGAVNGVAAVILAPGKPVARDQDDNDANGYEYLQVRNTNAQRNNPINYLDDTLTGFDNSFFLNSSGTPVNSFIKGPVYDSNQNLVINDQIIIITTDELVAMAEMATLQAYRDAVDDYQQNIWGTNVGSYRYPWLDDYSTTDLTEYDADINTVAGRMPSIFGRYFTNSNSFDTQLINPDLLLSIDIDGQRHNLKVGASGTPEVYFKVNGDFVSSINNGDSITRYFWDGHNTTPDPNSPNDGIWEVCPFDTGTEEDCNRDATGNFKNPHGTASDVQLKVRSVAMTFAGGTPIEFLNLDRTALAPQIWMIGDPENPGPSSHIYISGEYDDNPSYISSFIYTQDDNFLTNFSEFPPGNNGNLVYDAGDTLKIGLPYYPVLPKWTLDNNWHNSIQMAVSQDYTLNGAGDCIANTPCITVDNIGGNISNKVALLSIAGDIMGPTDDGGAGYTDDLSEIFELENADLNSVYDKRAGNDKILILREQ